MCIHLIYVFSPTSFQDSPPDVDHSNAYVPRGPTRGLDTSPLQQTWLALLQVVGSMLRCMPDAPAVCDAAVSVLVAGEARLLAACEPPAGTAQQPHTLAMAQVATVCAA